MEYGMDNSTPIDAVEPTRRPLGVIMRQRRAAHRDVGQQKLWEGAPNVR